MAKYKVEQVRDARLHPQLGQQGEVVKSKVVDESQVSATRAEMRRGMRNDTAASSDTIRAIKQ